MISQKIFVLVTDGVGLKNFVYSQFPVWAAQQQLEVVYWNATKADISRLGFQELKVVGRSTFWLTDVLKNVAARKRLVKWSRKFQDNIYLHHLPSSSGGFVSKITRRVVGVVAARLFSEERIMKLIVKLEKKSNYYKQCSKTLQAEKPLYLFCTNQRQVSSIAPIESAKALGILCGTFIFSWDNLPKATVLLRPNHYFVWSEFMKTELLKYYPEVPMENIIVTGTPQFENHYFEDFISREEFCGMYQLDPNKRYVCYSGDDVKTSPFDALYLADVATAIAELNHEGHSVGILFRRCPVDTSARFDAVLEQHRAVITPINPKWENVSAGWDGRVPSLEDMKLQAATIRHSELVINLGSSMVFDAAAHGRPCAYMNYDPAAHATWTVDDIYHFVHFQSMPDQSSVVWLNSPEEICTKIRSVLAKPEEVVVAACNWYRKIVAPPAEMASRRIAEAISKRISHE
ncbi:MAG: UDP-glycosyltransferase [Flavobacterium sp.]|nr:UDP-glycosyltransferase [Flavobacterium sp.]